jgi:hypothetical protein
VFLALGFSFSCATWDNPVTRAAQEIRTRTHQRIYFSPFESVWRAAQLSLKYPTAVNNIDEGIMETEWIDVADGYEPVHRKPELLPIQYRLQLFFVRGKTQGKPSVRLSIVKQIRTQKGFFNDSRDLESDGIEETVLFYRIERELTIEEAIKREAKRTRS